MKRNPSIHITEEDLVTILQGVLPKIFLVSRDQAKVQKVIKKVSIEILEKAKTLSISSRSITVTNDKLLKKTEKLKLANRSNTAKFAQMLHLIRRKFKHRGISQIRVGDKEWLDLKEATKLATEFSNEFGIGLKEGYKAYLEIGIPMMKNFSLFKFKNMHSSICNIYEAIEVIKSDKTPEATENAHNIYMAIVQEKIGWAQGFKGDPAKYRYFVEAKEAAKKFGVSNKIYMAAQFAGFEWANAMPEPPQLVGIKAVDRLQKYAFTEGIKIGGEVGKPKVNFGAIKGKK